MGLAPMRGWPGGQGACGVCAPPVQVYAARCRASSAVPALLSPLASPRSACAPCALFSDTLNPKSCTHAPSLFVQGRLESFFGPATVKHSANKAAAIKAALDPKKKKGGKLGGFGAKAGGVAKKAAGKPGGK